MNYGRRSLRKLVVLHVRCVGNGAILIVMRNLRIVCLRIGSHIPVVVVYGIDMLLVVILMMS